MIMKEGMLVFIVVCLFVILFLGYKTFLKIIYFHHFRPTVKQLLELPAVKKAKDRRARELYLKHTVQSVKSAVESALWPLVIKINQIISILFVAFCSFFSGSLTVVHRGRQQKSGGRQQKKSLELENSTVFHRGRQ